MGARALRFTNSQMLVVAARLATWANGAATRTNPNYLVTFLLLNLAELPAAMGPWMNLGYMFIAVTLLILASLAAFVSLNILLAEKLRRLFSKSN